MATSRIRAASIGVALAGGLWGAFWLPLRQLGEAGVIGAWATIVFFAPVLAILLPVALWKRAWRFTGSGQMALAGILVGGAFCLYATGLLLSEVVRVVLLFYLTPVWGTLLARLLIGQPVTGARLVALALGLSGLLVILGLGDEWPMPRNAGDWMGLWAGILWAGGTLAINQGPSKDPFGIVFFFYLCGTAFALIVLPLPIEGNWPPPTWAALKEGLVWIALLALVFTLPTMWMILWAARFLDPGRIGLLLLCEVVVAVVTAALFAGEPFGLREALGATLIVSAGVVEVLGPAAREA